MKNALSHVLALIVIAVCAAILITGVNANAEGTGPIVAEAPDAGGNMIRLYRTKQICVGKAYYAKYTNKDGTTVDGCWSTTDGDVFVVFLDGDYLKMPMKAFKGPKKA